MSSYPSSSARMAVARRAGQSVYWFQASNPNFTGAAGSLMPDDLLHSHPDGDTRLAIEVGRVVAVADCEALDVGQGALAVVVELHPAAQGDPGQIVLEAQADPRVAAEVSVLRPSDLGVHQERVRLVGVQVEPHH